MHPRWPVPNPWTSFTHPRPKDCGQEGLLRSFSLSCTTVWVQPPRLCCSSPRLLTLYFHSFGPMRPWPTALSESWGFQGSPSCLESHSQLPAPCLKRDHSCSDGLWGAEQKAYLPTSTSGAQCQPRCSQMLPLECSRPQPSRSPAPGKTCLSRLPTRLPASECGPFSPMNTSAPPPPALTGASNKPYTDEASTEGPATPQPPRTPRSPALSSGPLDRGLGTLGS